MLAQILVRRGLADPPTPAPSWKPGRPTLPPPSAASSGFWRRSAATSEPGCRITVHGDYDVDGVCATAIMMRALRSLGADVDWFLPSRIDDGYGLSGASIERLAERGTTLVLTVDCGITAVEEAEIARAAGVELVITDHHAPRADGRLPDCPIMHPAVCGYPVRAAVRNGGGPQARRGARRADGRRGHRAGRAGHRRRPGAADRGEPAPGARGTASSCRPPPGPACGP